MRWTESKSNTLLPMKNGSIAVLYERGEKSAYERITFAVVK